MSGRYRVCVLSSYIYGEGEGAPYAHMGRDNRWFHGFVRSLLRLGSGLAEFDVDFARLPADPGMVAGMSNRLHREGVRLVICAGTDAVVRWARANRSLPTLYFGAHPENNGLEILDQPNVSGVRLHLPLIWSFEHFALLRALLPNLGALFVPINLRSEFAFPNVRAGWRRWRREDSGAWIDGTSPWIGHRSVLFLAERLGVHFHEGPFDGLEELDRALSAVPPGTASAVLGFNDTVLLEGAVPLLLTRALERGLPLLWVNNFPIVRTGGVADFSSDFMKVGERIGELALRILRDGVPVHELPFESDPGVRFGLNLARCGELGLVVSADVRARFHEIVG